MNKVNRLIIVLFTMGLLISSSPIPKNYSLYKIQTSIQQSPHIYHYFQTEIQQNIALIEDTAVRQLSQLDVAFLDFEYGLRLLQSQQYENSKKLIQYYFSGALLSQKVRLLSSLWQQKQYDFIEQLSEIENLPAAFETALSMIRNQDYAQLNQSDLNMLGVHSLWDFINQDGESNQQCDFSILMVSDGLDGYHQLEVIKQEYELKPEPYSGAYCLMGPFYMGDSLLCEQDERGYANCKFNNLTVIEQPFDYVVTSSQSGLANVRGKTMNLNYDSYFPVFLHELMHFSGFEDEYKITHPSGANLCNIAGKKAPNLIVSNSPPAGWYESKTCADGVLRSYKPSREMSIMEYQAIPLSDAYRELWKLALIQLVERERATIM